MKENTEEAFWTKVWKTGECWRWLGRGKKFQYEGKQQYANRLAWRFVTGKPAPQRRQLVQQCETKFCINPNHWAPPGTITPLLIARFWSRINKRGRIVSPELGHCWEWIGGGQSDDGYGTLRWGDRNQLAHRVLWYLTHGEFPEKLLLHKCDNRRCVREEHLFEGTYLDNRRDCISKGRDRGHVHAGEWHPDAKLTEADVIEIRRLRLAGTKRGELANRFDVRPSTITDIVSGRKWKHIESFPLPAVRRPTCIECDRPAEKRFLCSKHYQYYKWNGIELPQSQRR